MVDLFALLLASSMAPTHNSKRKSPMNVFNAFQMVGFFAGLPFLIGWLHAEPFPFSVAALWLAVAVYIILFVILVIATAKTIKEWW